MKIKVIDGREAVYEGEAYMAVMPGRDGEFSILDFHQPILYRLRKGMIKMRDNDGVETFFNIKDGLARFSENSLLILCEIR